MSFFDPDIVIGPGFGVCFSCYFRSQHRVWTYFLSINQSERPSTARSAVRARVGPFHFLLFTNQTQIVDLLVLPRSCGFRRTVWILILVVEIAQRILFRFCVHLEVRIFANNSAGSCAATAGDRSEGFSPSDL